MHVPHISSKESVELVRNIEKLQRSYRELHLIIYFNDESLSTFNSNLKVAPPISQKSIEKH